MGGRYRWNGIGNHLWGVRRLPSERLSGKTGYERANVGVRGALLAPFRPFGAQKGRFEDFWRMQGPTFGYL